MSGQAIGVSVVIRTRDIETRLPELLLSLSEQTLLPRELVVVDNFSSKDKLEEMSRLLSSTKRRFFDDRIGMKLVPVADQEFSHAYSTNAGVSVSASDVVCITNGHSLPFSDVWLEHGIARLRKPGIAGVAGYSAPHSDGSFWEKLAYEWGWKRPNELSRAYVSDDFFSTVNCVLKKHLWEEYPFDERLPSEVPYSGRFGGEDYDWGREMFARGYGTVVEPKFASYHSHNETLSKLVSKYLIWRRIRRRIRSLRRPRKSFTRLQTERPLCYTI